MRKLPTIFITFLCWFLSLLTHAKDKPNVVFILSDDQSWGDYGFMGHPHIKTPHLDRLAGEGLVYERGYTTAAICRPSLASIVTGLYPHQTAVRGNRPFMGEGVDHRKLRGNKELWPLAQEQSKIMTASLAHAPSMVKQLRENGYATLQTGKWWEGNALDHGFDERCGHEIGRKTMKPIHDFVDKAQKNAQPFFIWYAVFLPHTPHNAPDRLYLKYKAVAPNESTARYWANIAWLDETCGQLVNHLKEKGLYDNTLFVFSADNGWRPDPEKVAWYTRSKKEPVEAGVRTPIFLTHKNKIAPRRDKTTLASNIDIAPTILHACGIEPDKAMSGLDLRKPEILAQRDRIFVDVYWDNIRIDALEDLDSDLIARVVVDGWNKLIVRPTGKELYNLKKDPDDRTDLAAQDPDKVKALSATMEDWLEATPIVFPVGPQNTDFDDPKVVAEILRDAVFVSSLRRVESEGKWLHLHGEKAQPYTGWARTNHGTLNGGKGNGKLSGLFFFKDGVSEPLSAGWHENGQKSSRRIGRRHVTWYANGQKHFEGHWKGQEKDGLWTTWETDGTVRSKVLYKDGKEVKGQGASQ